MRKFSYHYNQLEVTVQILSADDKLICEAKFPTPGSAKNFYEQTANWVLGNHQQPPLTSVELDQLKNLVLSQD